MSDTESETAAETPPTPEPAKARAKPEYATYDVATASFTLAGVTRSIAGMPESRVLELALRGAAAELRRSNTPDAAYLDLMDASKPLGRVKAEKPLDEIEQGFADVLMARLNPRKGPAVITAEAAADQARALTKEQRAALRRDPDVLHAIRKRAGAALKPSPLEAAIAALKPAEAA